MVQKLGLALSLPTIKNSPFSPKDISDLYHWYKFQTNITSDEDASGGAISPVHSTDAGTMVKTDKVNKWGDSLTSAVATQTTSSDKPTWDVWSPSPVTEKPNILFEGVEWLDIDTDISILANQDFSIMAHVVFTDLTARAIFGANANNFFRINNSSGFRCKIGGAGNQNFAEASDEIEIRKDFYVTLQRSDGAVGNLACYVHCEGVYEDKTWGVTTNTDPDAFTINNIDFCKFLVY